MTIRCFADYTFNSIFLGIEKYINSYYYTVITLVSIVLNKLSEYFHGLIYARNHRKFYEKLTGDIGIKEDDIILDVGCGKSPLSSRPRNYKIIGLDIFESVIKEAEKKVKETENLFKQCHRIFHLEMIFSMLCYALIITLCLKIH